mmetsp:Transcript_59062/g.117363  ORF Transcript_59062/g.117363 Transcript_59062/m.117363 type:complete len:253 (-) Transcript_59062:354-1112(-)
MSHVAERADGGELDGLVCGGHEVDERGDALSSSDGDGSRRHTRHLLDRHRRRLLHLLGRGGEQRKDGVHHLELVERLARRRHLLDGFGNQPAHAYLELLVGARHGRNEDLHTTALDELLAGFFILLQRAQQGRGCVLKLRLAMALRPEQVVEDDDAVLLAHGAHAERLGGGCVEHQVVERAERVLSNLAVVAFRRLADADNLLEQRVEKPDDGELRAADRRGRADVHQHARDRRLDHGIFVLEKVAQLLERA